MQSQSHKKMPQLMVP